MEIRKQSLVVQVIWGVLIVSLITAVVNGRWSMAFVSAGALAASILPALVAERFALRVPVSYVSILVVFTFSTLFLGEVLDFYERFWWWDLLMHGGSAVALGMIGFLFVFYLFEGDRYAAPPWALSTIAVCFAVTVGVLWEIFEFTMDQTFGLNMQKSGLMDTMTDLIVNLLGAIAGAATGFVYLKKREPDGRTRMIHEFVRLNRSLFRKHR
ncbi:MAG: hypothetical protein ACLFRU_12035 [Paracoccaceae bacterium]